MMGIGRRSRRDLPGEMPVFDTRIDTILAQAEKAESQASWESIATFGHNTMKRNGG